MSSRESAATVIVRPANSRMSPNETIASVTVDLRVFWPAYCENQEAVLSALDDAYEIVKKKIIEKEEEYRE